MPTLGSTEEICSFDFMVISFNLGNNGSKLGYVIGFCHSTSLPVLWAYKHEHIFLSLSRKEQTAREKQLV